MTREELLRHCNYYKGEDESPFEHGTKEGVFWYIESMYVRNAESSREFHEGWVEHAEYYIKRHPNERNRLTSTDTSIETKGIILYIDCMLSKWMPYKQDMIFEY